MASKYGNPGANPIRKIISEEVRKDQGVTPTFPIDETHVVEEAVEAPRSEIKPREKPQWGRDRLDADHSYDVGGDDRE
jgi:hypothetical protein